MPPALRLIIMLFLLSSTLASYQSSAKLRRDGVLNLYPFPRVGRASRNTWQGPLNDILLDYEPVQKRQLYAFPRVGRTELYSREQVAPPERRTAAQGGMWFGPRVGRRDDFTMPVKRNDQPGMWFGPRIGRSFKSDYDDVRNESIDRSEPEQVEMTYDERKKRQVYIIVLCSAVDVCGLKR